VNFVQNSVQYFGGFTLVQEPVGDRAGECRVTNCLVPVSYGELAGDEGGAATVAVFADFQQVIALGLCKDLQAPVVDDEQLGLGHLDGQFAKAAVAVGDSEGFRQAAGAVVAHGDALFAGVLSQGAGKEGFA